jgi:hypothetical protein
MLLATPVVRLGASILTGRNLGLLAGFDLGLLLELLLIVLLRN